jgi:hypothetical protein
MIMCMTTNHCQAKICRIIRSNMHWIGSYRRIQLC